MPVFDANVNPLINAEKVLLYLYLRYVKNADVNKC